MTKILIDEAVVRQALVALKEVSNSTGVDDYGHYVLSTEYDIAKVELATQALDKALTEQPAPPECKTEAEKTAYAFGWYKALESVREQPAPAQEPYGWKVDGYIDLFDCEHEAKAAAKEINSFAFPIYTAPQPPAPAQPLTDEQIANLFSDSLKAGEGHSVTDWVRRVEAAHGIKVNT